MRCINCNVDLPDEYSNCPLCGGKASPEAPVLEGIRTAEYPKVCTEPEKKNPFKIFLIIWAASCLVSLFFSLELAALVLCLVPFIWTLVFRPIFVKQLYAGNFIVMNLLPLTLASFVYSSITYGDMLPAIVGFMPISCIAVLVALTVLVIAKPKKSKRAAAYPVLFTVLSVILGITAYVKAHSVPFLWLGVIVISACVLGLIFFMNPKAAKEELKAKFSIQKSVSKIK